MICNSKNQYITWDTSVKHFVRLGLYELLPQDIKLNLPRTNIGRWKREPKEKYKGQELSKTLNSDLELFTFLNKHKKTKRVIKTYQKLIVTLYNIISPIKGIKQEIALKKHIIVNKIEKIKNIISVKKSIKVFNISRATYQNYKTFVLNKCDNSYFKWCVKNYPQQLLNREIQTIKDYMLNKNYSYWSKASVYYLALRNNHIAFCLTTWYKYCKLLGYKSSRHLQQKIKYSSLQSYYPNHIWCADATIFKTKDNTRHYIHLLIDHYSKKILGYKIETKASPTAIRELLQEAYKRYIPSKPIQLVTDGGTENVNCTVKEFLSHKKIIHFIAQKDIVQSNSMIEAINKILKHQFLLPKNLENSQQLLSFLPQAITIYNTIRPQLALLGNTPSETFDGKPIANSNYTLHIAEQKLQRIAINQQNKCKKCQ